MRKFVPLLVVVLASLISCQEDDDLMPVDGFKNKAEIFEKTISDAHEKIKKDSAAIIEDNVHTPSLKETDPPVKNGDHWKH